MQPVVDSSILPEQASKSKEIILKAAWGCMIGAGLAALIATAAVLTLSLPFVVGVALIFSPVILISVATVLFVAGDFFDKNDASIPADEGPPPTYYSYLTFADLD